jgi:hypothetical protein
LDMTALARVKTNNINNKMKKKLEKSDKNT